MNIENAAEGAAAASCGLISAFCVSPFLSVVDKTVTQKAAAAETGRAYHLPAQVGRNLWQFVVAPRKAFGPSFWMVCGVYGATYVLPPMRQDIFYPQCAADHAPSILHRTLGVTSAAYHQIELIWMRSFVRVSGIRCEGGGGGGGAGKQNY